MIDSYPKKKINKGLFCGLFLLLSFNTRAQSNCNNLNFASGTTNGWIGRWNNTQQNQYSTPPASLPASGLSTLVHKIVTPAQDPYAPILTVPPGHSYALRLGSDSALKIPTDNHFYPYNHQMMRNTISVTSENASLKIWTAIVFSQDVKSPHSIADEPYVKIRVYDKNAEVIKCIALDLSPTPGVVSGEFKEKEIFNDTLTKVIYRDWNLTRVLLEKYIGQQITIEFESCDCNAGGHFAYAYVAVDCGAPPKIDVSTSCQTDTAYLTGPLGSPFYQWSGPGISPPSNVRSVKVNVSGKYTLTYGNVGNGGVTCTYQVDTLISVHPEYNLIITDPVDSTNISVDLTKPEITTGSTDGATLSYWTDTNATVPLVNPTAVKVSGTYYIKLGTDACAIVKPVVVKVGKIITYVDKFGGPNFFKLYPNPTTGKFNLITMNTESDFYEINNLLGVKIINSIIDKDQTEIDLSPYANGVYFIRVYTKNGQSVTKKIIKE